MAGAMYGLMPQVDLIADHLKAMPRTRGAAVLAQALGRTVVRDYPQAIALCQQVLDDKRLARLHPEAAAFERLARQLQAGQQVQAWNLSEDGV